MEEAAIFVAATFVAAGEIAKVQDIHLNTRCKPFCPATGHLRKVMAASV